LGRIHKILYVVASNYKITRIRFWWRSLERWCCYSVVVVVVFTIFAKFCDNSRKETNGKIFM